MAASLFPSRQSARSALWYALNAATLYVDLANTQSAPSQPAYDSFDDWTPYWLGFAYTKTITTGTVSYDSTNSSKARLQQLSIVLNYASSVTYTDVLISLRPALMPSTNAPAASFGMLAFIHEDSPVTLSSGQSKTYLLDLTAIWA